MPGRIDAALKRFAGFARRLAADRRGVAAIEFAFVAPVLLSLYFVTMEVAQGIETNKKVGRVSSLIVDLVTQQQDTITKTELEAIMRIGEAVLQPYNRTKPTIVVTAIEVTTDTTPKVKVMWQRKLVNGAFQAGVAKGTITTIAPTFKVAGSYYIRVETELDYKPVIVWTAGEKAALGLAAAFDNISMKESYTEVPRLGTSGISCTGCY